MADSKPPTLPLTAESRKALFERLFLQREWGVSRETNAGEGSTLHHTHSLRKGLQALIDGGMICSIIDVGCGDFHWWQGMNLHGVHYHGTDVVHTFIIDNQRKYGSETITFTLSDIVETPPPAADLVLMKDVLTHLPLADCVRALNNIRASGARWFAATAIYPRIASAPRRLLLRQRLNREVNALWWRPINLRRAPFYFPAPLFSIPDDEKGKQLDIWNVADMPQLNPDALQVDEPNPISAADFAAMPFMQALAAHPQVDAIFLAGARARRTHRQHAPVHLLIRLKNDFAVQPWLEISAICHRAHPALALQCLPLTDATLPDASAQFPEMRLLFSRASGWAKK